MNPAIIFIVLLLFGLARFWRSYATVHQDEVSPSAPGDDESIEAYDRRMSGADQPESPSMARLRALNTYQPAERKPMITITPIRWRANGSESLEGIQEREGYGGRE